MNGQKKLYEEELVKEIMISTALCVQELLKDDDVSEETICEFVDEHYQSIIIETLNEDDEEDDGL